MFTSTSTTTLRSPQQTLAPDRQSPAPLHVCEAMRDVIRSTMLGVRQSRCHCWGGGGVPPLLVPLPSSALPAVVTIAITGSIVVLVVTILVITAHVVVERQYPGCRAIKPQVVGDRIAIPWMKIGGNVGTRGGGATTLLVAAASRRLAPPPPIRLQRGPKTAQGVVPDGLNLQLLQCAVQPPAKPQ